MLKRIIALMPPSVSSIILIGLVASDLPLFGLRSWLVDQIVQRTILGVFLGWLIGQHLAVQQITLFAFCWLWGLASTVFTRAPRDEWVSEAFTSAIEMWIPSGGAFLLFKTVGTEAAMIWLLAYFPVRLLIFALEWRYARTHLSH